MNPTFLTTLLALVASSVFASANGEMQAHQPADARHLRTFGRELATGGNPGPAPGAAANSAPAPGPVVNPNQAPVSTPAPAPAAKPVAPGVGTVNPVGGKGLSKGDAVDGTIAAIELTAAVLSLVPPPGSNNACRQVVCRVETTTEYCGMAAANKIQDDVMRGRDAFTVESQDETGMWVRYWRTQFAPANTNTVAEGSCGGNSKFVVSNCQGGDEVTC